jgi:hypothetical protein
MSNQPTVWKQSPHLSFAIICETKFSSYHADDKNVECYGGYLVAECVPPQAMPLILRAPQLEAENRELVEALDTLTLVVGLTPLAGNKEAMQEAMNAARAVIAKYKGAA